MLLYYFCPNVYRLHLEDLIPYENYSKRPLIIFIRQSTNVLIRDNSFVYKKESNSYILFYKLEIEICTFCTNYIVKVNQTQTCNCHCKIDATFNCETCKTCIAFLEKIFILIVFSNKYDIIKYGKSLTGVQYVLFTDWWWRIPWWYVH